MTERNDGMSNQVRVTLDLRKIRCIILEYSESFTGQRPKLSSRVNFNEHRESVEFLLPNRTLVIMLRHDFI